VGKVGGSNPERAVSLLIIVLEENPSPVVTCLSNTVDNLVKRTQPYFAIGFNATLVFIGIQGGNSTDVAYFVFIAMGLNAGCFLLLLAIVGHFEIRRTRDKMKVEKAFGDDGKELKAAAALSSLESLSLQPPRDEGAAAAQEALIFKTARETAEVLLAEQRCLAAPPTMATEVQSVAVRPETVASSTQTHMMRTRRRIAGSSTDERSTSAPAVRIKQTRGWNDFSSSSRPSTSTAAKSTQIISPLTGRAIKPPSRTEMPPSRTAMPDPHFTASPDFVPADL